jgi:hypothetical protein
MQLRRISLVIVAVVAIVTAAVPALRHQAALQLDSLQPAPPPEEIEPAPDLAVYRSRAAEFVATLHSEDPAMLLAAGLLTDDLDLLRQAAEAGDLPAAHAAYVGRLSRQGQGFMRVGNTGADPADPKSLAAAQKLVESAGSPTTLDPEEGSRLLDALHAWQRADPENALPVALEARILYGLHHDEDSLVAWAQAGRMAAAETYSWEHARSIYELLTALGLPDPEALRASSLAISFPTFALLRDSVRFANYEGQLAQVNANPIRAITWWHSSTEIGRSFRDSADFAVEYQVGVSLTEMAAYNLWQFHLIDPQLVTHRLHWGPYHELYADAVGPGRDAELREELLVGRARSALVDEYLQGLGMDGGYLNANRHLGLAAPAGLVALLLLLVLLFVETWSRGAAEAAAALSPVWQFLLGLLVLLPIVTAGAIALRIELDPGAPLGRLAFGLFLGFLIAPVTLALAGPFIAAVLRRASAARASAAWRGNLRLVLPVAIALTALLSLACNIQAMRQRAAWVAQWTSPDVTEMSVLTSWLDDRWTDPEIPLDGWRAEYPPESQRP